MRPALAAFIILALAILGSGSPAQAQRANWPAGSWQASCRSANVTGQVFTAECQSDNGSWRRSSISLNMCPGRLVGNRNGTLFCEGGGGNIGNLPGGSWRASCQNGRMNGNVVSASCSTGSGYRQTSFSMRNCPGWALGNANGNLFCESGNGGGNWNRPGHFPGGSWQNSCGNARLQGHMFSAQCSTGSGYRATTFDLRACPSRLLGNRNGFLFCER
jgi:CVNH domain